MKMFERDRRTLAWLLALISVLLTLFLPGQVLAGQAGSTSAGISRTEALRVGQQMYRQGILSSGEPIPAVVKGDIPAPATAFTCASCHLRSGLGAVEGLVYTPPTNGSTLFRPLRRFYNDVEVLSEPPLRPAYTDKTLADVIRSGIDPTGRKLNDIMPRYMLDDRDMAILISYLKSLSSELSPGATHTTLHFGTIIAEDVRLEDRDAMLKPLENYITLKNNQARGYKKRPKNARMEGWWASTHLILSLSQWVLKGSPDTWRSQLEEYYRRDPVFALIGGIANGEWQPIHDFSEAHHIPTLFPVTDFPVISESDWYTLYFSKGLYQEGEAAARYLDIILESLKGGAIVEVVRYSAEGLALSKGFEETWRELGHPPVKTVTLKKGEPLTGKFVQELSAKTNPAVIVLWDGPSALSAINVLASGERRPGMLLVSGGYLGESILTLQEKLRGSTYITYPFGLSQGRDGYTFSIPFVNANVRGKGERILKKMYALLNVLTRALIEMRGNYYRDNFFDVIDMMPDQRDPLYERLSFGSGQRFASKGCYIVQLSEGPDPKLVKKSDWIIQYGL